MTTIIALVFETTVLAGELNTIVFSFGIYQLIFRKRKVLGNHILTYSYLIFAAYGICIKQSLIFIVVTYILSILCFKNYLKAKEAK